MASNGNTIILLSNLDDSVNMVSSGEDGKYIETRIVQRQQDELIIYVSSQTGCHQSCRFCFLTQSGQTSTDYESWEGIYTQINLALKNTRTRIDTSIINTVNINFMARGDLLSNRYLLESWNYVVNRIINLIHLRLHDSIDVKFKISTIFPNDMYHQGFNYDERVYTPEPEWLNKVLMAHTEIYYSLYSLNPTFRKKWIPKGSSPKLIGDWFGGSRVIDDISKFRLHYALIKGENDSASDANDILNWLVKYNIQTKINIVRYNPYDPSCGSESDDKSIADYISILEAHPNVHSVQLVPRVGTDVKASCGQFIESSLFTV